MIPLKVAAYYVGRRVFTAIGLDAYWNKWWASKYLNSRMLGIISAPGVTTFQITGVPRSGTTLLGACIDNHSKAICLLEPHRGILERGGFKLGLPESLGSGYPAEWTKHPAGLLKRLSASAQFACVGFKETYLDSRYYPLATDEFLKRNLADGYVDKCIAIIRDPRDSWVSVLTRFGEAPHAPGVEFVETWNSFAAWLLDDAVFFIRYEDLVTDPERTLRSVCVELGLEFEAGMTQRRSRQGVGDRRALEGDTISSDSVGRYAKELDADYRRFIESHCQTLMNKFGYEVDATS